MKNSVISNNNNNIKLGIIEVSTQESILNDSFLHFGVIPKWAKDAADWREEGWEIY